MTAARSTRKRITTTTTAACVFAERLSDAQIADEAIRRLAWDAAIPEHAVTVQVADGRITLHGELQRDQQKAAVLEDLTRLFGVSGVTDCTTVKRN